MKALTFLFVFFLIAYAAVLSPGVRLLFSPCNALVARYRRLPFWVGLVAVVAVISTYAFIVFNHSFPMTEGWYTEFAKYILNGRPPYQSFELLLPPVYTYTIAGIVGAFGFKIIVLRVIGALLFMAIAILLYLIFSRVFAPWISVIAACVAALYMQSETANVFYDYIRAFDLLNLSVCLFLVMWIQENLRSEGARSKRATTYACLCGLLACLSLLVRQSSGAIVAVFCLALMCFDLLVGKVTKAKVLRIVFFLSSALAPIVVVAVVLLSKHSLGAYLDMTAVQAMDAKGGIATVLFGWVPRTLEHIWRLRTPIAVLTVLMTANAFLYWRAARKSKLSQFSAGEKGICLTLFTVSSLALVVFMFRSEVVSTMFDVNFGGWLDTFSLLVVGLLIFVSAVVGSLIGRKKTHEGRMNFPLCVLAISGFYVATAYGSATSSGFSASQSAIAIGLLFALSLYFAKHFLRREITALVLAVALCVGMASVAKKYERPYSWWGLAEQNIRANSLPVDVPLLDGILVSSERKEQLEGIYADIVNNSDVDDPIFVFPHMPILYAMTDRYPETFTIVQWFDVSSQEGVLRDIETLRERPPKVIVACWLPEWVIAGHEKMFNQGGELAQRKMMKALRQLVADKDYTRVSEYCLGFGYIVSVYSLPTADLEESAAPPAFLEAPAFERMEP